MNDYEKQERFDRHVRDIAHEVGVEHLLSLPGVWEIVSEAFNNDALKMLEAEEEDE
jgi:hypothetical protein